MRKFIAVLSAAILAIVMVGCDVDVEDKGTLPDVDVRGGDMPDVDVTPPDVDVGTKETTVTVPDVDVSVPEENDQ